MESQRAGPAFWIAVLLAPSLVAALAAFGELAAVLIALAAYYGAESGAATAISAIADLWRDMRAIAPTFIARQAMVGGLIGAPLFLIAAAAALRWRPIGVAPALFAAACIQGGALLTIAYLQLHLAGFDTPLNPLREMAGFMVFGLIISLVIARRFVPANERARMPDGDA